MSMILIGVANDCRRVVTLSVATSTRSEVASVRRVAPPIHRRETITKAIRVHENGGPEVLSVEDVPVPTPSEGEVLVKLEAVGVNFIDVNQRSGAYKVALPFTPGTEGAGVVADIGPGVSEVSVGDRVAFAGV